MLFRRKRKKAGSGAQHSSSAKRTGTNAQSAKTGGRTRKTGPEAKGAQAKSTPAKSGAQRKDAASTQQSRAQAEAQIKQMMNDGSLDKLKTLMKARNPDEVAEEYPEETVSVIRDWLNNRER